MDKNESYCKNEPSECKVCLDDYDINYKRPRFFSCGHTFCSECICDIIEDSSLACPTCRTEHQAPHGVVSFPIANITEDYIKYCLLLDKEDGVPLFKPAKKGAIPKIRRHSECSEKEFLHGALNSIGVAGSMVSHNMDVNDMTDSNKASDSGSVTDEEISCTCFNNKASNSVAGSDGEVCTCFVFDREAADDADDGVSTSETQSDNDDGNLVILTPDNLHNKSDATDDAISSDECSAENGLSEVISALREEMVVSSRYISANSSDMLKELNKYKTILVSQQDYHEKQMESLRKMYKLHEMALKMISTEQSKIDDLYACGKAGKKELAEAVQDLVEARTPEGVEDGIIGVNQNQLSMEDWFHNYHEMIPDQDLITYSTKLQAGTEKALEGITSWMGGDLNYKTSLVDNNLLDFKLADTVAHPQELQDFSCLVQDKWLHWKKKSEKILTVHSSLTELIEENKVCAVKWHDNKFLYADMGIIGSQIYVSCLQESRPDGVVHFLPFNEVRSKLECETARTFLHLSFGTRIIIDVSPSDNELAQQFITLCSGEKGYSYLGSPCTVTDDDECLSIGASTKTILHHKVLLKDSNKRSKSEGVVISILGSGEFKIIINEEDDSEMSRVAFGDVEKGLDTLQLVAKESDSIKTRVFDCGFILPEQ